MRLFEFEGKSILSAGNIRVPKGVLVSTLQIAHETEWQFPVVAKAQLLYGNRKEKSLIAICKDKEELYKKIEKFLLQADSVLVEEFIPHEHELYFSIKYDTQTRGPLMLFSQNGGAGIEHRGFSMQKIPFNIEKNKLLEIPSPLNQELVQSLFQIFFANDCSLLEINPLLYTNKEWIALDAKIEFDDIAKFRHPEWDAYPSRPGLLQKESSLSTKAKQINALDRKGVAGASFFEFDGTIGVLASGGGASQVVMDGLLSSGLKPANYTEYSGNPTREKVRELAKLVLSIPHLEALWVVGGNANFTDIYETLAGVMDAIEATKLPKGFPVVIRRGGPRWQEAFEMLKTRSKKISISLSLYGPDFPMLETTGVLVKAVEKFRKQNTYGNTHR